MDYYNKMTDKQIFEHLFEFEYANRNEINGYKDNPEAFKTWVFVLNWVLTGFGYPNNITKERGDYWIFEDKYIEWKKINGLEGK